jgi:3-methyladenine DNA glycosylase AlkD
MIEIILTANAVCLELKKHADPVKADFLPNFFKTGIGQYGYGDKFIGVVVPKQRLVAKKYIALDLRQVEKLLHNPIHECRLTALLILVFQFKTADIFQQKKIVDFYLNQTAFINNWDLVDLSAQYILGVYFFTKDKKVLFRLAKSANLWERRISIIACLWFIRKNQFTDALKIAKILLKDDHDLIHKAVGWMLREIGKRDLNCERIFLDEFVQNMPRTMLRYAIEKFDQKTRREYLEK